MFLLQRTSLTISFAREHCWVEVDRCRATVTVQSNTQLSVSHLPINCVHTINLVTYPPAQSWDAIAVAKHIALGQPYFCPRTKEGPMSTHLQPRNDGKTDLASAHHYEWLSLFLSDGGNTPTFFYKHKCHHQDWNVITELNPTRISHITFVCVIRALLL